jgi:hypothetical protein
VMSRRKHGIFISAPHDGQVYVAERSRRGTPSSCTCSRRPTARVLHNLIQLSPHKETAVWTDSPNEIYGISAGIARITPA